MHIILKFDMIFLDDLFFIKFEYSTLVKRKKKTVWSFYWLYYWLYVTLMGIFHEKCSSLWLECIHLLVELIKFGPTRRPMNEHSNWASPLMGFSRATFFFLKNKLIWLIYYETLQSSSGWWTVRFGFVGYFNSGWPIILSITGIDAILVNPL